MSDDDLYEGQYPSLEDLEEIRTWPHDRVEELFEHIRKIWWQPHLATSSIGKCRLGRDIKIYEFHTGGWSGNEDIIDALQDNIIIWATTWQSAWRGGHYVFHLPYKQ